MGQYFKGVILKHNEDGKTKGIVKFVDPSSVVDDFEGMKLTEHSYIGSFSTGVIELELVNNPQMVVWTGDYADIKEEYSTSENLYKLCKHQTKKAIKLRGKSVIEAAVKAIDGLEGMRVINHDKKQWYVRPCSMETVCVFNPLPILTADSNGGNGGDYKGKHMELVGTWAGDTISYTFATPPSDYKRIYPEFMESWQRNYWSDEEQKQ